MQGGKQIVSIDSPGCTKNAGIVSHELLHSLGKNKIITKNMPDNYFSKI